MRLIKFFVFSALLCFSFVSFAQDFEIVPQSENPDKVIESVEAVGNEGGKVRDIYNQKADDLAGDVGDQLASGIMTWDTLLNYIVYLVKFLSQVGLLVGAVMIVFAGYQYATTIFGAGDPSKGKKALRNAICGVLVVAFSYAIMKALTSAFLR